MSNTTHPLPPHGAKVLVWVDDEETPRSAEYISNQWCVDGLESPGLIRAWMHAPTLAKECNPQAQQPGKVLTDEPYAWEWQELVDEGPYRGWHSMLERFNPLDNPYRKREASAVRNLKALYLAPATGLTEEPVAWMSDDGEPISAKRHEDMEHAEHPLLVHYTTPLYLAPAAGLTVEETMDALARYFFEVQQVAIGHKGSKVYDDLRARLTAAMEAKTRKA